MANTSIEWADKVWNPVTGCTKVSEGCRNCYAKALHDMRHEAYQKGKCVPEQYSVPFDWMQLHMNRLEWPNYWKKPQRVFVNSMSDLFHENLVIHGGDWSEFIIELWDTMKQNPQHTFMILTKRPKIMEREVKLLINEAGYPILPNVWLGTSIENQKAADERMPYLLQTPAAKRFVSCEPLLGPVDLYSHLHHIDEDHGFDFNPGLHWVICGGESGTDARPMHPDWARALRDECQADGVPFFFKQWGEWKEVRTVDQRTVERYSKDMLACPNGDLFFRVGKKSAGRVLDGRTWNEFPKV